MFHYLQGFSIGNARDSKDSQDETGRMAEDGRMLNTNERSSSLKPLAKVMTSQAMGFGLGPKGARYCMY